MFNWLFKSKDSSEKGYKNMHKDISLICIYAAYNVDDDDMKFINDNCNECTFIVIDSLNRPYLNGSRLKNNDNIYSGDALGDGTLYLRDK